MDIFDNGQRVEQTSNETPIASPESLTSTKTDEIAKELKLRPYRDYFNLNPGQFESELNEILDWANPTGRAKKEEILEKINSLNTRIGQGEFGESKIAKIAKFVKIYRSINSMLLGEI